MQHWMNKRKNPIRRDARRAGIWAGARGDTPRFAALLRRAQAALVATSLVLLVMPLPAMAQASAGVALAEVSTGSLLVAVPGLPAGRFGEAPRLATQVDIDVHGPVARATVEQTFANESGDWIEATYVFPLPDDAAVDHLELTIGERRIVGEIQPKAIAERQYQEATRAGKKAALLSQQRPNLFTTSVSNIGPGETVRVQIEYQQRVRRNGDRYSLRVPLTLTPRYIPGSPDANIADRKGSGWSQATDTVADAADITPPMTDAANAGDSYRLNINASIETAAPLAEVISRYHRVDVQERTPMVYNVSLSDPDALSDHDFELEWQAAAGGQPAVAAFSHSNAVHDFALLQVMPPGAATLRAPPPRELVLVIDTSGSMHGISIAEAKTAVEFAIRQLRDIDSFNIIEFNNDFRALFPMPQRADLAHRERAIAWVQRLEADGGTEMRPALRRALERRAGDERLRQVVFVTDGAVGNEEQLFADIERLLGGSRLFTIGIGSAPNGWFMRKAAELGRGRHLAISSVGEVAERMQTLLGQLSQPVLTDIRIDWHGSAVEQMPATVADLYANEPIELAVRFAGRAPAPREVTLSGTLWDSGNPLPWSQEILIDSMADGSRHGIGVVWARAKIEAIADARRRGMHETQARADIESLAMAHHLVSEATSLVAVDTTPARTREQLAQRSVAGLMPYGQTRHSLATITATATPAALLRLSGVLALLLALALASVWRGRADPAARMHRRSA